MNKFCHKESNVNCPCWHDGFQTSEAENGFNWRVELAEKIKVLKEPHFLNTAYSQGVNRTVDDVLALINGNMNGNKDNSNGNKPTKY